MPEFQERFKFLEDQVEELNIKWNQSNKWQKAMEKWLMNTFDLDICELIEVDEHEASVSPTRHGISISKISTVPGPITSSISEPQSKRKRKQDFKLKETTAALPITISNVRSRYSLPPLHRIIPSPAPVTAQTQISSGFHISASDSASTQKRLKSPENSNCTNGQMQTQNQGQVNTNTATVHRPELNISLTRPMPKLNSHAVSITTVHPRRNSNTINSNRDRSIDPKTNQGQILILPTDRVGYFHKEEREEIERKPELLQYGTEITEVNAEDEPDDHKRISQRILKFDIIDEPRNDDNNDSRFDTDYEIQTSSQGQCASGDFYTFSLPGLEDTINSDSETNDDQQRYENVLGDNPVPAQYIKSVQGFAQLAHDGYIFSKERCAARSGKIIWKCTWYKRSKCPGRCHTLSDLVIYHFNYHNHHAEFEKIESRRYLTWDPSNIQRPEIF